MKSLDFTKEDFPAFNGTSPLRFNEKAIIRGIIVAGQNPRARSKAPAAKADIDMKIALIRSALDFSGNRLRPTAHFTALGRSAKAPKSKSIGDALCAHAAYKDSGIVWLVDIERLPPGIRAKYTKKSKKRPDYLGLDLAQQWHVFECKGRSKKPSKPDLKKWRKQARAIKKINGAKPKSRIVSAAYINARREWELLWKDPPTDKGVSLEFPLSAFFDAYYKELLGKLFNHSNQWQNTRFGPVIRLPESGVSIGLHWEILDAAIESDAQRILRFAQNQFWQSANDDQRISLSGKEHDLILFSDGLLIRIDDHK